MIACNKSFPNTESPIPKRYIYRWWVYEHGGDGSLGIFRTLDFAPEANGQFQGVAGDFYVAAIEFSNPVRAMVFTSYGNASQAGSPHISD